MDDIYISKQQAAKAFQEYHDADVDLFGVEIPECFDAQLAIEIMNEVPAADVRPVVLCRDCKHGQGEKMDFWNEYEGIECIGGVVHRKDWFCADGEKKEET